VETSYIYKPDEKNFVLVLHIPLVTTHNLMPLYKFIPLPVHFNFSGNISVTPEVGATNMIAVGHSQSYQLLSSTDLKSCNKMEQTYFCKGRNILLTDLNKTCLGALYLADTKNIQGQCKFSIGGAQEKIFHLDSNTYMVYSLRKINTNHVCPKAKSILAVQISSGQTVRINPSCYIITADVHSKWLDWTWTLGQLFQQPENEVVTAAIDKLRSKISCKFDTEVLLHKLETMTKEAKELAKEVPFNHWIFTSPRGHDWCNLGLHFLAFLLLETLPNQRPSYTPSPLSISSTGSANHFQHDSRADSQMKNPSPYLKTI
jgi:hypothetical protein